MTDAYAEAGLFQAPQPQANNWNPLEMERVTPARLRDDLTTETHIWNGYTQRWIRNNNANRQRILAQGGHESWHRAYYPAPEIVQVRNGTADRRRPGDRYVIAGLEMVVVRDLRV
jgi:hypothetical protein